MQFCDLKRMTQIYGNYVLLLIYVISQEKFVELEGQTKTKAASSNPRADAVEWTMLAAVVRGPFHSQFCLLESDGFRISFSNSANFSIARA